MCNMFHVFWCQDSKPLPDKDYCLYQILPEICGNLHSRRNFLSYKIHLAFPGTDHAGILSGQAPAYETHYL